MKKALTLALRNLPRDWRHAELRILVLALVIAVAAISAVNFFTDRIHRLMEQQATELLGGDLRISAPEPLPTQLTQQAHHFGLQTTPFVIFRSVVLHNEETLLTEVKAVTDHYPLRGQLRVADNRITTYLPTAGKVWVEPQLLTQLNLHVGDSLSLGEMRFTIENLLTYEPDRGGWLFQIAPRVLMNLQDVEKTQLISAGSRVTYGLLVKGETVAPYRHWLETHFQAGKIEGVDDAQPELRLALERAEQFLGLAAIVAVLLGGTAVAMSAWHFSRNQTVVSATLRCLGATEKLIWQIYLLRLLVLGGLASGLGCGLGWLAQIGLAHLLANYFSLIALPTPSWQPVLVGMAAGLITLLGFAVPPLWRIQQIPPVQVLRRDEKVTAPLWQILGTASIAIGLLIFWQAPKAPLAISMIGGTLATLLILMAAAYGLVRSLQVLKHQTQVAWRFGLTNLARRAPTSSVQLTAFGIGIMALLLLAVVRVNLLKTWQNSLPEGTPNHFIINIQPQEIQAFRTQLATRLSSPTPAIYPIVRGRLLAINNQPVSAKQYTSSRAKHLAEHTFNLSYVNQLPPANQLQAGHFWQPHDTGELSVEQGLAQELGIQLGDTLRFQTAGQEMAAKVTSLRTVQWDSLRVNFFILTTPDVLQGLPTTYLTAIYVTNPAMLTQLLHQFPSITIIDLQAMLSQVRRLMDRATLAIEYVFLFTLLASLVVLSATILASQEERLYEGAILRTLGATRSQLLTSLIAEFTTLGLLAGGLAAFAANSLGAVLAKWVVNLPYQFDGWVWLIGLFGGALGIGLAGVLGTRSLWQRPPLETLRRIR